MLRWLRPYSQFITNHLQPPVATPKSIPKNPLITQFQSMLHPGYIVEFRFYWEYNRHVPLLLVIPVPTYSVLVPLGSWVGRYDTDMRMKMRHNIENRKRSGLRNLFLARLSSFFLAVLHRNAIFSLVRASRFTAVAPKV